MPTKKIENKAKEALKNKVVSTTTPTTVTYKRSDYKSNPKILNLSIVPKIVLGWDLYRALCYLLKHKYNKEFTVLTYCEREGDTYNMFDYFIPEQDNTACTTEFDGDDIISILSEGADLGKLMGHMHSHVDMDVYASGTDFHEIVERAEVSGWNCSIVMNKDLDVFGHIVDYDNGMYIEDVDVRIDVPLTREEYNSGLLAEIKRSDSIQHIAKLAETSYLDFCVKKFPLSQQVKSELDKQVKSKFKSVVHQSYNNYGTGYGLSDMQKEIIKGLSATERTELMFDDEDDCKTRLLKSMGEDTLPDDYNFAAHQDTYNAVFPFRENYETDEEYITVHWKDFTEAQRQYLQGGSTLDDIVYFYSLEPA